MLLTREQKQVLVEKLITMWNSHDLSNAAELYAENYRGIDVTDQSRVVGPEGVAKQLGRFYVAFPDLVFHCEETVLDENRLCMYWTARGTHRGTLMNIPSTGRRVRVNGVSMISLEQGNIVHGVHLWDMAALLRSIGLLPELERRAPLDTITLQDALTICE